MGATKGRPDPVPSPSPEELEGVAIPSHLLRPLASRRATRGGTRRVC